MSFPRPATPAPAPAPVPPAGFPARVLVTTRDGGVGQAPYDSLNLATHVGDAPAAVAANRQRLRNAWCPGLAPTWLEQVHGTAVVRLDGPPGAGAPPPVADAAFTTHADAVVAILTADCLPVVLAGRAGTVVGAAHAGWRGLHAGVLEALVAAMRQAAPREDLVAWLGPCIGPDAFEVGPEVREAFLAAGDPAEAFVRQPEKSARWRASLPELARHRLVRAGVDVGVAVDPPCTVHDARFFSHRASGGRTGRFATLVRRLPDGAPPSVKPLQSHPPEA